MTDRSWIRGALGEARLEEARSEASRRRLRHALGLEPEPRLADEDLRFLADGLELQAFELLAEEPPAHHLRSAAAEAFQLLRVLPWPTVARERDAWLVRLGCLALLGDRGADFRRLVQELDFGSVSDQRSEWGEHVWATTLEIWLRLLRKKGWEDFRAVEAAIARLRADQALFEPAYLARVEPQHSAASAFRLVVEYHLAKAAELLGSFLSQGSAGGKFDIRQQLDAQFDRALVAADRGGLVELEVLARILARTAQALVANSIWSVTRAVNSRVTRLVRQLTSEDQARPIFEMLPPQRKTLREAGLLGSSQRAVVVSLPTSSGKTLIAQFRMLQALNQFDAECGWVAYIAPTRALVNQLTIRLRRDFGPLGISVEKLSPALELDSLESDLLTDRDTKHQFRVVVSTPEKLDLLIRQGWESKIGRPLTLVVVDEAHNLASKTRGLKLELLLATINRECLHAQFLLLTPFVRNAEEIARWLEPASHQAIDLAVDWTPNDRAIVLAEPTEDPSGRDFGLRLRTLHTSSDTLFVPESLVLSAGTPLGLTWSKVRKSPNQLAAATAQLLLKRGTVIVLTGRPDYTWAIAEALKVAENRDETKNTDREHIGRFLRLEMGDELPLAELLEHGIGVHHAGLSDDTRSLVEWLMEQGQLKALVATTTIASGVNFPVSAVVLASHQYPYGNDIPPEDFWNIAGRAGRVDQGDLGIVALVANDRDRAQKLERFVSRQLGELTSTLIEMVQSVMAKGEELELEKLAWLPSWSVFLQYLAHTYRQMDDHQRFATEIEQVLRGTLGFEAIRKSHPGWANQLVDGVHRYSGKMRGKPLSLVDSTGFSLESVMRTLARLKERRIDAEVWTGDLFGSDRKDLEKMMGILLEVSELREHLEEVVGSSSAGGNILARMVCDWVKGRSLQEMATSYFGTDDRTKAMTDCCRAVFGRLTQTASWGLSALQSLTLVDSLESLPESERRSLRNLPAKVYYGVDTDEAVAMRLLGIPRLAAQPIATALAVRPGQPLSSLRARLRSAGGDVWKRALGPTGETYRRVWTILEGER